MKFRKKTKNLIESRRNKMGKSEDKKRTRGMITMCINNDNIDLDMRASKKRDSARLQRRN